MCRHLLSSSLVAAAVTGLLGCSADQATAPSPRGSFARGGVPGTSEAATYAWHVGDAFGGGAVALSSKGHPIILSGTGTLSVFPNAVTGGGEVIFFFFVGPFPFIETGTWTATELLSFQDYGASPVADFPPDFHAGKALMRVHLTAFDGQLQLDGTLRITSRLPQTEVPGGFEEGVRLAIDDGVNFNREAGGATRFVVEP
jgi:hypothetical protein